jgi:hypothetical protein
MIKKALSLPLVRSLFEQQRKAIKLMRKSNKMNRFFRDTQVELHATSPNPFDKHHKDLNWKTYSHRPIGVVMPVKTRWWSTVKSNKRFVRLKPALVATFDHFIESDDISDQKKELLIFSPADWKVMETLVELLAPFKKAIKELEGSSSPVRF